MKIINCCILLLLCFPAYSQHLSKADYIADLEYLKDTLPKRHINLFTKLSKADFEQAVDKLERQMDQPEEARFIVGLYRLMKTVGDEHTHVEPVFTTEFPVKLQQFSEGFFITGTDTALVGINGHTINDVLQRFKAIIKEDNASFFSTRLLEMLNNPVILKGLAITDNTSESIFQLRGPDGKVLNRVIRAIPIIKRESQLPPYTFSYDQSTGTLNFKYRDCRNEPTLPFLTFNKTMYAYIATKHPKRLVIDLRDNDGGNSGILNPFIDSLKNSYLNTKGKLFVLIGRRTFSSALMNAVDLKRKTNAILIGEPTSGSVNHYGEVRGFRLPHSHMMVDYSTRYWENWAGHDGPLIPDVPINYSEKNHRRGIDEALVYVNQR
ncbi:MAG: hypothetical protein V4560_15870 [Bacteroidota bacterium]